MNIDELRQKIDETDKEITRLFEERMKCASLIADYKKENGLPVFDEEREKEVTKKVTANVSEEFIPYTEKLYNTIFTLSRSYQVERMGD